MNTKNIPAIMSLSAGAITSIITYIIGYEVKAMLGILLAVLLLFYVAGLIVKAILDKFQKEIAMKEEEEERFPEKKRRNGKWLPWRLRRHKSGKVIPIFRFLKQNRFKGEAYG